MITSKPFIRAKLSLLVCWKNPKWKMVLQKPLWLFNKPSSIQKTLRNPYGFLNIHLDFWKTFISQFFSVCTFVGMILLFVRGGRRGGVIRGLQGSQQILWCTACPSWACVCVWVFFFVKKSNNMPVSQRLWAPVHWMLTLYMKPIGLLLWKPCHLV